ncbi:hypothetical protein M413DRAFT_439125 [Hebeloma cylindrosporum]|uniref:HNH nuclease domain-containing protein n=1 Tax=Hebeloma cylindrosporum TaxID=76867 RepID=A0A0C3CU93_HEBCY|nr:hypothetical protein M413DRAFT_439125 [Hebeloma cylindrosporum h7]
MNGYARRLESNGKSSDTDISAHVASFDDLGIDIARIESSDADQSYLISSARQILDNFSKAESRFVYGPIKHWYDNRDHLQIIVLDKILSAMLSHAQLCGGQEGLRYIASVIVACHERGQSNGGWVVELQLLESMAITMLTQFLFIFRAQWPVSEDWLGPTFDDPPPYVGLPCLHQMSKSERRFRLKLLIRQGFTCFLSGYGELSPLAMDALYPPRMVVQRQIFRWPTAIAEDGSESHKSATRSFNILKKFTRISANNFGELKNIINDPSNGMLLIMVLHRGFDELQWCLQPTEVCFSLEDRAWSTLTYF